MFIKGNEHHLRTYISTFCVKNFVVNRASTLLKLGVKQVSLRNRNAPVKGASWQLEG